jgi:hypothetical protein
VKEAHGSTPQLVYHMKVHNNKSLQHNIVLDLVMHTCTDWFETWLGEFEGTFFYDLMTFTYNELAVNTAHDIPTCRGGQ